MPVTTQEFTRNIRRILISMRENDVSLADICQLFGRHRQAIIETGKDYGKLETALKNFANDIYDLHFPQQTPHEAHFEYMYDGNAHEENHLIEMEKDESYEAILKQRNEGVEKTNLLIAKKKSTQAYLHTLDLAMNASLQDAHIKHYATGLFASKVAKSPNEKIVAALTQVMVENDMGYYRHSVPTKSTDKSSGRSR